MELRVQKTHLQQPHQEVLLQWFRVLPIKAEHLALAPMEAEHQARAPMEAEHQARVLMEAEIPGRAPMEAKYQVRKPEAEDPARPSTDAKRIINSW